MMANCPWSSAPAKRQSQQNNDNDRKEGKEMREDQEEMGKEMKECFCGKEPQKKRKRGSCNYTCTYSVRLQAKKEQETQERKRAGKAGRSGKKIKSCIITVRALEQ